MYLSKLKIWNFRKYGESKIDKDASLEVTFKNGLNVLVGENDSGKTAIIDAIKFVLGTNSGDFSRIQEEDFHSGSKKLKLECIFTELTPKEGANFLEWVTFKDDDEILELKIRYTAEIIGNRIKINIKAGKEGLDKDFSYDARDLLRVTYLKPLRDAESELKASYKSRFAYILKAHSLFQKDNSDVQHELEEIMEIANKNIEEYFSEGKGGFPIKDKINKTLKGFIGLSNKKDSKINISDEGLDKILKKLNLSVDPNKAGLGTLNLLFMATELLLLDGETEDNKLCLIEEIEAHLHPQAQLRVIKYFEKLRNKVQSIITTHSITLASSLGVENLILCKDKNTYPLRKGCTKLSDGDYQFLERFLDSTKANMFFAKGIIMVEGDAENLLLPVIAEMIERPLYEYGVSIVNVGSVAFLRYSNIFLREDENQLDYPVAIVTDLDIFPKEHYPNEEKTIKYFKLKDETEISGLPLGGVLGETFASKDELINKIKEKNVLQRFKKGQRKKVTDMIISKVVKEKITIDELEKNKKKKAQILLDKYNKNKNKVFYPQNWTLEYDMALSCLKMELLGAILIAKQIASKEEHIESLFSIDEMNKKIEEAQKQIEEWEEDDKTIQEIAYLIYEPLLKKNASKAITAQWLGIILNNKSEEEKTELKAKIIDDNYLEYVVNAIKYATNFIEGSDVNE